MKNFKNSIGLIVALFILVFFGFINTVHGASDDIIFTEIMYNPSGSDTKKEWIEIYNSGAEAITIIEGSGTDSWRFNDGSNHTLTLFQGSLTIASGGYTILASDAQTFLDEHTGFSGTIIDTVMSLNNTSDTVSLSSDKGSSFFGSVTYDDILGADGDGYSLQLSGSSWIATDSTEGQATASQESQEEATPTPSGSSSSPSTDAIPGVSPPDTEEVETPQTSGIASKVKITEIFPNPIGDENQEFIELWNNQNESISLEGFKLADASKVITLSGITLVPGEYFAIYRSATKIALNNSKETIFFYDASGNLIDSVEYSSTIEGYSLSYDIKKKKFLWSYTKTPSRLNEITTPNDPPEAVITFSNNPIATNEKVIISAQDSTDADDDKISCLWKIGKNFQVSGMKFKYSFNELGSYLIKLIANDGQHEIIATSSINVLSANDILSLRRDIESLTPNASSANAIYRVSPPLASDAEEGQIYITEIFPNPAGRDNSEWIELYNSTDFDISLDGWIIDDQDGGSKPHTILDRTINAQSYLILGKEEIKITLNNSSDEVRLFNSDEKLIDEVLYDDVQEDESYSKTDDGFWFWTQDTTPSEPNITDLIILYNDPIDPLFFTTPASNASRSDAGWPMLTSPPLTDIVDIDLPNIRELELGTEVRVQGTVAVEPGILGKTYFYITGSPGIQVYFYKKDWPKLTVGDVIGVIGELTESNNELRLKISNKEDIVPLYTSEPPTPIETQTGEISESLEGALIKILAQLIEKKGTSWYLDDGSGEAKITFQPSTNIKKPSSREGDWIEVVGIVSETKSGYRVLPRYQNDINIVNLDEIEKLKISNEKGIVLGESATLESDGIQRFKIKENNSPNKILYYLIITTSALMILFAGLFIKLHVETKKREKDLKK